MAEEMEQEEVKEGQAECARVWMGRRQKKTYS